jgi:hypothetical protein
VDTRTLWVLVLGVGAGLRILSAVVQSRLPLEPDARGYLVLARQFDPVHFWAANLREPLWIALVKSWSVVFGYSPASLRALTALLSIAVLLASAHLFRGHLAPRPAIACTAVVAIHGLLVLSAGRGLREELVSLLVLGAVGVLISLRRGVRERLILVGCVAALGVVRLEIGFLAAVLLVAAALIRRVPWSFALLPVAVSVLLVTPWLVANEREYGSATASSDNAASFWYRADRYGANGVLQPGVAPDKDRMTWSRYLFTELGPVEVAKRVGVGTVGLVHDSISSSAWPLEERWVDKRTDSPVVRAAATGASHLASGLAWLLLAVLAVGLVRTPHWQPLQVVSGVVVVCVTGAYAVLWRLPFFELRFVELVVPFVAVLMVSAITALPRPAAIRQSRANSREARAGR